MSFTHCAISPKEILLSQHKGRICILIHLSLSLPIVQKVHHFKEKGMLGGEIIGSIIVLYLNER